MFPPKTLSHGIPKHDCFGIIQPCYENGGLDCSAIAYGIGEFHTLKDPYTQKEETAILLCRNTLYTDSYHFDAIMQMVYGMDGEAIMKKIITKNPGMSTEIVELWILKKAEA